MFRQIVLIMAVILTPLSIFGEDIPSTGARSTNNNTTTATAGWSNAGGGFIINWNITQVGTNYHYIYSITGKDGGNLTKAMSHFILEVSPSFTANDIFNSNVAFEAPKNYAPGQDGNSNPGLPADIFGIKFDATGTKPVIDFMSSRPPIWGDFYTKDGFDSKFNQNVYAYNTGFGTDPKWNTTDFSKWIPVPGDGKVPVPEPSTYLILGTILLAVVVFKLRTSKI